MTQAENTVHKYLSSLLTRLRDINAIIRCPLGQRTPDIQVSLQLIAESLASYKRIPNEFKFFCFQADLPKNTLDELKQLGFVLLPYTYRTNIYFMVDEHMAILGFLLHDIIHDIKPEESVLLEDRQKSVAEHGHYFSSAYITENLTFIQGYVFDAPLNDYILRSRCYVRSKFDETASIVRRIVDKRQLDKFQESTQEDNYFDEED